MLYNDNNDDNDNSDNSNDDNTNHDNDNDDNNNDNNNTNNYYITLLLDSGLRDMLRNSSVRRRRVHRFERLQASLLFAPTCFFFFAKFCQHGLLNVHTCVCTSAAVVPRSIVCREGGSVMPPSALLVFRIGHQKQIDRSTNRQTSHIPIRTV